MLLTGFPPLARADARVLVLGSMPGVASLTAGRYYAHPANLFWRLLADVLGEACPDSMEERTALLLRRRIAVWDVVYRCRRAGSLDAAIDASSVEANDIAGFVAAHPALRAICFNGAAAEQLFRRHAGAAVDAVRPDVELLRLPSSSPANASWSYARKRDVWRRLAELAA